MSCIRGCGFVQCWVSRCGGQSRAYPGVPPPGSGTAPEGVRGNGVTGVTPPTGHRTSGEKASSPPRMSRSLAGSRLTSRSPTPEGPQRKISAPAYYASPSYISIENSKTRKSSFKKFGVQKESNPDKPSYDPSLLFARATDR